MQLFSFYMLHYVQLLSLCLLFGSWVVDRCHQHLYITPSHLIHQKHDLVQLKVKDSQWRPVLLCIHFI